MSTSIRAVMIRGVRWYQRHMSANRPPCCKYYPTCSNYAIEALEKYGAVKGTYLTIYRLLRCHPLGGRGLDPVPAKFRWRCWCRECRPEEQEDKGSTDLFNIQKK